MDVLFFLKGVLIGFAIAAPVGPVGVLCIQRTCEYGRMSGFLTGLGAATADGFYGIIAAFGITVVSDALIGHSFWLEIVGGLFLMYLGVRTLMAEPKMSSRIKPHKDLHTDYLSTAFLTLTNPMTILAFVAVFTGMGLVRESHDVLAAILLAVGVFAGSALWWLLLSGGVSLIRHKLNSDLLKTVNVVSGAAIVVFAMLLFVSLFVG